jgi:hypothetical protein
MRRRRRRSCRKASALDFLSVFYIGFRSSTNELWKKDCENRASKATSYGNSSQRGGGLFDLLYYANGAEPLFLLQVSESTSLSKKSFNVYASRRHHHSKLPYIPRPPFATRCQTLVLARSFNLSRLQPHFPHILFRDILRLTRLHTLLCRALLTCATILQLQPLHLRLQDLAVVNVHGLHPLRINVLHSQIRTDVQLLHQGPDRSHTHKCPHVLPRLTAFQVRNLVILPARPLDHFDVVERGAGPDRVDAAGFVVLVPVELGVNDRGRILWDKNGIYQLRHSSTQTVCLTHSWQCALKASVTDCLGLREAMNSVWSFLIISIAYIETYWSGPMTDP